jgi:ABC-type transport system involved in cytochrome c biogenesis permease subunit
LYQAYQAKDIAGFNTQLATLSEAVAQALPYDSKKAGYEVVFNQSKPFISAAVIFVFAFLFGCFGLLTNQMKDKSWATTLLRTMTALLVVAFLIHTIGIASRVYLQGRPPITNLYSSAVFIGWFSVLIGLIIDRKNKSGLGGMMASVIGFGSLIIAHNLGASGDTMEMMQAVLDSNFWLATHVVVVTIGYSATFFAGFLGIAYVMLGVFTPRLDRERGKSLIKMVYGVICFATVTSFVGTVLGGIWADQSWGRFWGWDAKENGAALIVLWNLLILHARWGGMIKDRGLVVLAIFGNIITAWSWFGTNMLGVGLHSYGFTQSAVFWISMFVLSQLVFMGLGLLPIIVWRSKFQRLTPAEGS